MEAQSKDRHCREVKKGIAKDKFTSTLVSKTNANNTMALCCPACGLDVIIRNPGTDSAHFAHKTYFTPIITPNESNIHLGCKQTFYEYLGQIYPEGNWEMERSFKRDNKKDYLRVQADISGRVNKVGVIIEVQASATSIATVIRRTKEYCKRGGYILWIIPLREEFDFNRFYRPRKFERYLHSMFYGRVYYWIPKYGTKLLPVHFLDVYHGVESRSWFENGEEQSGGGYDKRYKTLRDLKPGTLVDIADSFKANILPEFNHPKDEDLNVPERKVFIDNQQPWWKKGESTFKE